MSDFVSELLGQQCKSVKIIHYMNICLGFGDSFEDTTLPDVRTRHDWEIYSWDGIWRVTKFDKVLFGCGNREATIEAYYPSIIGLTIEGVDYKSFNGDLRVTFEDGTVLEILSLSSRKKSAWSIYGPDGQFPPDNNPPDDIDADSVLVSHAKACFNRWSKNLPLENKKQNCNNCAFYYHLRGASYFWDFGICTNKHSKYDGRVVNIGSLCDAFSYSLQNSS